MAGRFKNIVYGGADLIKRHNMVYTSQMSGGMWVFADITMQILERKMETASAETEKRQPKKLTHDFKRTASFAAFGLFLEGPLMYTWMVKQQPRLAPTNFTTTETKIKSLAFKVLVEMALFSPIYNTVICLGVSGMKGGTWQEMKSEWHQKFLTLQVTDWKFWPAIQFVNYGWVPVHYQTSVSYCAGIVWDMIVSYTMCTKDFGDKKPAIGE